MGLFSFLFGGKKTDKAEAKPAAAKPSKSEKAPVTVKTVEPAAPVIVPGIAQAKLRLKLAASLRTGQHDVAYEAARGLADIQLRAGRKTVARVWQQEAERIRIALGA